MWYNVMYQFKWTIKSGQVKSQNGEMTSQRGSMFMLCIQIEICHNTFLVCLNVTICIDNAEQNFSLSNVWCRPAIYLHVYKSMIIQCNSWSECHICTVVILRHILPVIQNWPLNSHSNKSCVSAREKIKFKSILTRFTPKYTENDRLHNAS